MRRSWIKIETNTPDKPEICVIASQLRLDADAVMGKLVRLWAWAELNVSDRNETSVTTEFLDKVAGKKGFSAALEKAGWLQRKEECLVFPRFERHNGRAAKGRAQTALRVSRHRKRKSEGEMEAAADVLTSDSGFAHQAVESAGNSTSSIVVESHGKALVMNEEKAHQISRDVDPQHTNEPLMSNGDEPQNSSPESDSSATDEAVNGLRTEAEVVPLGGVKRKVSRVDVKDELAVQALLF